MNRVDCAINETTLENDDRRLIPGVQASCSRCGHTTESYGVGVASRRRCLALMRDECPNKEQNLYIDEDGEDEVVVEANGRAIVVNIRPHPGSATGDAYDTYIGRAGQGHDGYFGNPVAKDKLCPFCGAIHSTNESTLPCFEYYFNYRIANDAPYRDRVLALRGHRLGCFCSTPARIRPCHGHIMAKWINTQFPPVVKVVENPVPIKLQEPSSVVVGSPSSPTLCERAMNYVRSLPMFEEDIQWTDFRACVSDAQNNSDGSVNEDLWYELDDVVKLISKLRNALGNVRALTAVMEAPTKSEKIEPRSTTESRPVATPDPSTYIIGFAGTSGGMTELQYTYIYGLIDHFKTTNAGKRVIGEHGDYVGSDAHFDVLCAAQFVERRARPANTASSRANTGAQVIADPEDPIVRKRKIVDDCSILVATPATPHEMLKSETWATIRYAQSIRKPVVIVFPDGSMKIDNCT